MDSASATSIPSTVAPGRTNPSSTPLPFLDENREEEAFPLAPDNSNQETDVFFLEGIKIEGNTVYSPQELNRIFAARIHKPIGINGLTHIADLITQKYRQDGYLLTKAYIPQQDIQSGTVTIKIIEGYISQVDIEGTHHDKILHNDRVGLVESFRNFVLGMKPFNVDKMQHRLMALNDMGGISASTLLVPIPSQAAAIGAVGLKLTLEQRGPQSTLGINNLASRYLGPTHATASTTLNNLLVAWDELTLSGESAAPTSKMFSLSPSYSLPIFGNGDRLSFGIGYSNSAPAYTLKILEIEGSSNNMTIGYSHNFIRSRQNFLDFNLQFEAKNIDVDVLGTPLYKDRIRKIAATFRGGRYDGFKGLNEISLTLSRGFDLFGAKGKGDPDISRSNGREDATVLNATYSRTQALGTNFEAIANVAGQYSAVPLLASEEFGYGGSLYGRAYDPSEITGDQGISALFELRYRGLNLSQTLMTIPFVYYDFGQVWNIDETTSSLFGSSAGAGLRVIHQNGLRGEVLFGWPLTRLQQAPRTGNSTSPRILFNLSYTF